MTASTRRIQAERVVVHGQWTHPLAPHGTRNGYQNFFCRCKACGLAWNRYCAELRQRRAADHEIRDGRKYVLNAPHGTPSGYSNHGCRCEPCKTAKLREMQRWPRRKTVPLKLQEKSNA